MNIRPKEEELVKYVEKLEESDLLSLGVTLTREEMAILLLPPKTCLNPTLNETDFESNIEVCHTNVRYTLRDEQPDDNMHVHSEDTDNNDDDNDLKKKVKKGEAMGRMIFDDKANIIDKRKRKVTDLSQMLLVVLLRQQ